MAVENKPRNKTVDILRGIAMLMVVLGHTVTGSTVNSESSFLYNIIWTIQMPLFMLISGYVIKYSRPVSTGAGLGRYVIKKTLAYLLPWAVWTFLIRGLIFGRTFVFDIKALAYHMDVSYWFLFSLWTIALVFGLSQFVAEKASKSKGWLLKLMILGFTYVVGMAALAAIGLTMGLSFFCLKLTLYYMPFFFAGFLYGYLEDLLSRIKAWSFIKECAVAVALVVWMVLLNQFVFFTMGETIVEIAIRAIVSLTGCIAICGLVSGAISISGDGTGAVKRFLYFVGTHSLEVYLIHYLTLGMVELNPVPEFASAAGLGLIALNFVLTAGVTCLIAYLLSKNKVLKGALFGKLR